MSESKKISNTPSISDIKTSKAKLNGFSKEEEKGEGNTSNGTSKGIDVNFSHANTTSKSASNQVYSISLQINPSKIKK